MRRSALRSAVLAILALAPLRAATASEAASGQTAPPLVEERRPEAPVEGEQAERSRPSVQLPGAVVVGRPPRPRIVLLEMGPMFAPESWPAVERRSAAELRAMGLEVVSVTSKVEGTHARMAELGAQVVKLNALAGLRIVRDATTGSRKVAVWVHDALTGKMLLREVPIDNFSSTRSQMRTVTDVVELLQASFVELNLRGRQRQRVSAVPAAVERLVRRALPPPARDTIAPRRWRAWVSAGALFSAGTQGEMLLGVGYYPLPWLLVGVEGHAPLFAARVTDAHAESSLRSTIIQTLVLVDPWRGWRLRPVFGLGLGALVSQASGQTEVPSAIVGDAWALAFVGTAHLLGKITLSPGVALTIGGALGLTLPKLNVRFGDNVVAVIGRPVAVATLGLQWAWGF